MNEITQMAHESTIDNTQSAEIQLFNLRWNIN